MRAERGKIAHKPAERGSCCGNDDDGIGSCGHGGCSSILRASGDSADYLHDIHHMMRCGICNGGRGIKCGERMTVMPREGGASSTPWHSWQSKGQAFTGSSAGACHRAALRADPLADDDISTTVCDQ